MTKKWKLFDHALCSARKDIIAIVGFVVYDDIEFIKGQYLSGKHSGKYGLFLEDELNSFE